MLLSYLWGVIWFIEDKDSILHGTEKDSELEARWVKEDEEILALIAADMHQDFRAWEAVWLKVDPNQSPLDVSPVSVEMELEESNDAASMSEASDVRFAPRINPLAPNELQI